MENKRSLTNMMIIFLIGLTSISCLSKATEDNEELETYIVYLRKPDGIASEGYANISSWYRSFLPVTTSSSKEDRLVYSYSRVVACFAAKLTKEEAKSTEKKDGVLLVRPQKVLSLHSTHTPSFLGLQQDIGLWNLSNYGKGVIIGLVDIGITPDHPSFGDERMPPPPATWKGKCENGIMCNKKLIGARNFDSVSKTPLDEFGHGTHTASTAAGSPVPGANVFGQANGTATGVAPLAHSAMYSGCSKFCSDSDILAAIDAAIEDGVGVLSLSLGLGSLPFYEDVIATGAYRAIQKGIFMSC